MRQAKGDSFEFSTSNTGHKYMYKTLLKLKQIVGFQNFKYNEFNTEIPKN